MDTTTNTTTVPAWRQKIAGIRQRVDEADAKKREEELNNVTRRNRQRQIDLFLLLRRLGIIPMSTSQQNEFASDVSTRYITQDATWFELRYSILDEEDEDGHLLFMPMLMFGELSEAREVPLTFSAQISDFELERSLLLPLEKIAYSIDVALDALELEAAR